MQQYEQEYELWTMVTQKAFIRGSKILKVINMNIGLKRFTLHGWYLWGHIYALPKYSLVYLGRVSLMLWWYM